MYKMNNVKSETHNACSQEISTKNLVKASSNRKNIIGAKFPRKLCPPPSIADLKEANALPITFNTNIIALTITGRSKTAMKAKTRIKTHLSEALVFDTTTRTAMYIIRNTTTVARINHNINKRGSDN